LIVVVLPLLLLLADFFLLDIIHFVVLRSLSPSTVKIVHPAVTGFYHY